MSFAELREFNDAFGVITREEPAVRVPEARLRFRLIAEETQELLDAVEDCDIVEVLDACADIDYVVEGAVLCFGLEENVSRILEVNEGLPSVEWIGSNNPLLSEDGREIMLDDLRTAILTNDSRGVAIILATFLHLVRDVEDYFDLDVDAAVTAVHKSNMTKLDENGKVLRRASDLKIMKSALYQTPTADLESQLFGRHYAVPE